MTALKKAISGAGLCALLMTAAPAPAQNATLNPESTIYGWNGYSSTSQANTDWGWYRFTSNGEEEQQWIDNFLMYFGTYFNVGYIRNNRICGYYGNSTTIFYLEYEWNGSYDNEDEKKHGYPVVLDEIDIEGENAYKVMLSGAYNEADDHVYGFSTNLDQSKQYFVKADAANPSDFEIIRELPDDFTFMISCCFSPVDHYLYGVDVYGDFVRCDVYGNFELLGLGKDLDYGATLEMGLWESGMTYSPKDNAFIWNRHFADYTSDLVKIDAKTYKWSKISSIPVFHQFTFLDTTDHDGADNGPARAEVVENSFAGASLDGSLTYKMPTKLADGTDAPASMTWTATCGDIVKTGTAAPGETVKVDYTAVPRGRALFNFRADAGDAKGITRVTSQWVGADVPARPQNIELAAMDNGKYKVTWTAPDYGAHNGYLDTSTLRYAVFVNNKQVNTATADCEMELEFPDEGETKGYYCVVYALSDGLLSEGGVSNSVYVGQGFGLPFFIAPTQEDAEKMTVINVDNDKSRWNFMDEIGAATCYFSSRDWDNPGDDYLITPPLYLDDTSKAYEINFQVRCHNPQKEGEYFDIWMGKTPTVDGIRETQVVGKTRVADNKYNYVTYEFSPKETGRHYLGLHYIGDADQAGIYVRNIKITKTNRPAAVTEVDADSTVNVWPGNGEINISAESGVAYVYRTDGSAVARKIVKGDASVSVAPGMYIVAVNGKSFKVNVK